VPLTPTSTPRYGPRYRGRSSGPSYGRGRRGPSRVLIAFVVLVLVAAGGAGALLYVKKQRDDERARRQKQAEQVSTDYLAAWSRGDDAAAAALVTAPLRAGALQLLAASRVDLHAVRLTATPRGPVTSAATGTGVTPGVDYAAALEVRGLGPAAWTGRVPLVREDGTWRVAFTPEVVHPALHQGGRFIYARTVGTRGKVLLADGRSMSLDSDLTLNLRGKVETIKTDADATAIGPNVAKGDDAGTSGLQRAFNDVLQGQPGGSLTVADAAGRTTATLATYAKKDGTDVRTTLALPAQQAAAQALRPVTQPASMAVLDARSGAILALSDGNQPGFPRALGGKYPPGSTFKVVTSVAALANGVPAGQVLDCSPTVTVNGRTFKNAENESAGPIGFATAFAKSCNTWFSRLQGKVPIDKLTAVARLFGFAPSEKDAEGLLPVRSFGGSYPPPRDRAQAAGQAIGQDLVQASPLQMASVVGAIATGSWHKPRVVLTAPDVANALPPGTADTVRGFMAGVVAPGGTAGTVAFPGGVVGKTGTAEVQGRPDDSWFIAIRGTVAVACEVDGGGFGADVAAPAVARFFAVYRG